MDRESPRRLTFPDSGSVSVEMLKEYETHETEGTKKKEEDTPRPHPRARRYLMWVNWAFFQFLPPVLVKLFVVDLHYIVVPRIYGKSSFPVQVLIWVLVSVAAFTFYASSWMPPGKVWEEEARGRQAPNTWRECNLCSHPVPVIARHCHICKVCIWERDHHCFIIGNCIGRGNINAFNLLCILGATCGLLCVLVLVVGSLWYQTELHPRDWFLCATSFLLVAGCSLMYSYVEVTCVLLVLLSVPASASWIFPDQNAARDSRDNEGVSNEVKLLSLVSGGQSSLAAAPYGLTLLRHLLQAERNNIKATRSLDGHTGLGSPPSGLFINHGGSAAPPFTSHASSSCCSASGFKPSTYFTSAASGKGGVPAYKRVTTTTTTTHKPIQTFNAINIYRPIFSSHVVTTYKPLTHTDASLPHHTQTTTTTTHPPQVYNNILDVISGITTSRPTHNIYIDTTTSLYKDTNTVTTYRPSNHNQIKYKSSANKLSSTVYGQRSNKQPQRNQHATSNITAKRKGRGYQFGYEVTSHQHGTAFGHKELSDGDVVRGEYRVQLPDGRLQVVTYTADGERGFLPVVRYEGGSPLAATHSTHSHSHA